ncbi:MAG: hypothetical protein ACTSYJ_08160, partial [Candidatus Thorarchaeota archaeon]
MAESLRELHEEYPSIHEYKARPQPSSVAAKYLRYLAKHKDRWVPTSELHHIYYSTYGTHANVLIKLAKSQYVLTAKGPHVAKSTLQTVISRYWKIAEKG